MYGLGKLSGRRMKMARNGLSRRQLLSMSAKAAAGAGVVGSLAACGGTTSGRGGSGGGLGVGGMGGAGGMAPFECPPTDHAELLDLTQFVLANAFVLTMDAERRYFLDGAVAVEDGVITAVGPSSEIVGRAPGQVIDCAGTMLMPGYINTHFHNWGLLRALGAGNLPDYNEPDTEGAFSGGGDFDALSSEALLLLIGLRGIPTPDETYAAAAVLALDALKQGETTLMDVGSGDGGPLAQALVDLGLRGVVTMLSGDVTVSQDGSSSPIRDTDSELAAMEDLIRTWNGAHPRIRVATSCLYHPFASDALLSGMIDLADRNGIQFNTHVAALANERPVSLAVHGREPIERMDDFGALDVGTFMACHCGFVNDDEITRLAATEMGINHTPATTGLIGQDYMSQATHPRLWQAGVPVAVGTDGGQISTATVHESCKQAANIHMEIGQNDALVPSHFALEMGTSTAARVIGWDDIGSLAVGQRADVVAHRIDDERYVGETTPLFTFLSRGGQRGDVDTVVVDGRIIMRESQVLTVNEAEVRQRFAEALISWGERLPDL